MLSESANLSIFKPFIDEIRLFKPYQLEEKLEKIIIDKAVSGRSSWVRLFDETINNLKFQYGKKILNSQEIFDLTSNHNESTRKRASKAIGKTFSENSKTFSFITNICFNLKTGLYTKEEKLHETPDFLHSYPLFCFFDIIFNNNIF